MKTKSVKSGIPLMADGLLHVYAEVTNSVNRLKTVNFIM